MQMIFAKTPVYLGIRENEAIGSVAEFYNSGITRRKIEVKFLHLQNP